MIDIDTRPPFSDLRQLQPTLANRTISLIMSQYPHGYGQYHGSPPQYSYPYQSPAAYTPPVYGSPPDPRAAAAHYAMSQNSFNHNANTIPGLGIVGTPNSGSAYNPPGLGGWGHGQGHGQAQTPSYSAGAPGLAVQQPVPMPDSFPQERQQQFPTRHDPPQASNRISNTNEMGRQDSEEMEEGELSEGQFEDLYEPREPALVSTSRSANQAPPQQGGSNADMSRGASVVDTPEAGFYLTEEEEPVAGAAKNGIGAGKLPRISNLEYREPTCQGRERSGSYSPYLSPREIQCDRTPNDGNQSPQGMHTSHGDKGSEVTLISMHSSPTSPIFTFAEGQ